MQMAKQKPRQIGKRARWTGFVPKTPRYPKVLSSNTSQGLNRDALVTLKAMAGAGDVGRV